MPVAVLCMEPNTPPVEWKSFCQEYPPFSVAVDGYASGPPAFNKAGPHFNFNHHEGVNRLATRSTCAQVFMAAKQGLFFFLQNAQVRVYANDCDDDVCLAWTVLKHGADKDFLNNPKLEALVRTADLLDTTSGTYSFPKNYKILEVIAWIFQPYRSFRISGQIDKKEKDEYAAVVAEVEERIGRCLWGQGKQIALDTRYEVLRRDSDWVMVKEIGEQARIGMSQDGIRAFVTARQRPDGKSWTYNIGRASVFVPFDLPAIFSTLNTAEGLDAGKDKWGGGDTIGGSPRVKGSKLSPEKLIKIIDKAK